MTSNRRDILRMASTLVLAIFAAGTCLQPLRTAAFAAGDSSDIRSYTTAGNKRCAEATPLAWHTADNSAGKGTVQLDFGEKKQEILGFGGAFTDAACYTFNSMPEPEREKVFHQLFSPSEMNLSVSRICMGSSDYSTHVFSYDEGEPDPDMKRFSIAPDKPYILPMLAQARKVNPDLFILASPWSPPGWMKPNKSMLGGNMQRKSLEPYAKYFLKFLKAYEAAGVPVQAVTVQNEVDTDQDSRMPACAWPQEYEIDFVRNELGPTLEKNGIKTKIWIIDHNYNLWGRAVDELEADKMDKYVGGIAWHGYVGSHELMTRVHNYFPKVDMYWTEGGPDYTQPDYATDWTKWSSSFSGILNNWCKTIITWNLSLDERGKPNIGPFPCGGLVTVNSKTKAVSYSGQYWAIAHFSRFIKRGAHVVSAKSEDADLSFLAAENPDGNKVLVATNPGKEARTVSLQVGKQAADLHLEPDSVNTFIWK
jgi:glucosylceramidase